MDFDDARRNAIEKCAVVCDNPAGGFVVLGLILAVIASINQRKAKREKIKLQAEMKKALHPEVK